ncbi:ADF-like domain-containing protein [Cylindrobasidium torrendii FP15055 ss-10]|uniref:ADF-like domain-containing protein n=1 Tax=Cylindrobasidium torrendii FP15055 ss-10 TaxID=1314674 RepID=A0A0D7BQ75_9AGAR|nr:ADF-like domain-containing protein [Cylindrobasidium torrendii FP15055 ss-10]
MADVDDPKIREAYDDVRNDKSETTWMLMDYETDRSDKLVLTQTGSCSATDSLAAIRDAVDSGKATFGYARVQYANDKESTREKFVFVKWIGSSCKIMRKAKVSVHAADVKNVIRLFSIELDAHEAGDFDYDRVVKRLRQAGGASYDGV